MVDARHMDEIGERPTARKERKREEKQMSLVLKVFLNSDILFKGRWGLSPYLRPSRSQ